MSLSEGDRLILMNIYELLKEFNEDREDYYNEASEILSNGFEIFYSAVDAGLSDPMPSEDGRLVLDILSIYRSIEDYKRDNPEDEEVSDHDWGHFLGFDGNNEPKHLSFTRFLIFTQNKFQEQLKYHDNIGHCDSHTPVLHKYRSMINRWRTLELDLSNRENILEVLNA